MSGAKLIGSRMYGVVGTRANLRGALLSGANLGAAVLIGADLTGANFAGAVMSGVRMSPGINIPRGAIIEQGE